MNQLTNKYVNLASVKIKPNKPIFSRKCYNSFTAVTMSSFTVITVIITIIISVIIIIVIIIVIFIINSEHRPVSWPQEKALVLGRLVAYL